MIDFDGNAYAGKSKDDFICNAFNKYGLCQMYIFRNNQWYRDTSYLPPYDWLIDPVSASDVVNDYYFGIYSIEDYYLIVGRPKIHSK